MHQDNWKKIIVLMTVTNSASSLASIYLGLCFSFWLFEQTQQALLFSIAEAIQILPYLLLLPVIAIWIDRLNKKSCLLANCLLQISLILILLLLYISGYFSLIPVLLLICISVACECLVSPAMTSMIQTTVPKNRYLSVNGLFESTDALSMMIAAGLAGLSYETLGIKGALLITLTLLLIECLGYLLLPNKPFAAKVKSIKKTNFSVDFLSGLAVINHHQLRTLILASSLLFFLWGCLQLTVLVYLLAQQGPTVTTYLFLSSAIGMGLGAAVIFVCERFHLKYPIYLPVLLQLLLLPLCLLIYQSMLFFLLIALFSVNIGLFTAKVQTQLQLNTPEETMARVKSIETTLTLSAFCLGSLLTGFLIDHVFNSTMMIEFGVNYFTLLALDPEQVPYLWVILLITVLYLPVIILLLKYHRQHHCVLRPKDVLPPSID